MAGQSDGSIIIDTELNSDGLKAGSAELLSALKSLTDEVKNLGTMLKEIFTEPLTPEVNTSDAEGRVAALEEQVQELQALINEMNGASTATAPQAAPADSLGQTTQKASDLQRQIDAVNTSVDRLEPTFQKAMSGSESAMATFDGKATALENKIAELQQRLDAVGKTKFPTQEYEEVTQQISKAEQALFRLYDKQDKMQALGVKESSKQWQGLQYDIQVAEETLERFERAQAAMKANGTAFTSGVDTSQYAQMSSTLTDAASRLAEMRDSTAQAEQPMSRIAAGAKQVALHIGTAAKSVAGKLLSGLKAAASHMARMVFHGKSMNGQFGGLISSAKKFTLSLLGARGVYALLRKAVSAYMSENQQLANTLSSCWSGIGNILGPIITRLINLVAQAVAYVTAFLKLFGAFSKGATQAISSAGGAAADAAKDLKRQLASFDELNVLSDNSSDSGGGGGGGAGSVEAELPEVTLPDWAKLMVEQIKAGDWAAAALTLADQLNSMVEAVDWEGIGQKIGYYLNGALTFLATFIQNFDWKALGSDLATLLNNVITSVDWHNLGVVLGAKFKILIEGLGGFFETLDWASLGKALSDCFMGLWNSIDWKQAAKTISDGIKGLLTTITEFLKNTDWEKIGEDIGSFFAEIDWDGIAEGAFSAFNAAIEAIKGMLHGLPNEIVTVGAAFASWKISSALMSDLGVILGLPKSLSIGITLAITGITLEAGGIVDAIENELDGFNFAEILAGGGLTAGGGALIGQAFGSAILGGAIGGVVAGLPAFGVGLYDAIVNGLDWLNGALTVAGSTAAGAGIGAICAAAGTAITPGIGTLIGLAVGLVADGVILVIQHWDEITSFLTNFFTVTIPNAWNSFVSWITQTVPAWFQSLPGKISKWFSDLWQPIKDFDWGNLGYNIGQWFGNAVKDAIKFVTETVPNWLSSVWNSITTALSTFFTVTLPKFFTEWIPQAWEDIKTFFSELPQKIWEAIQAGWNWLVDVGKSIIDGIWEGLQTVWTAITEFVDGFVQGFKDALGIHSPSTVFAEIGGYLIEGLLQGIKNVWESITSFFSSAFEGLKNLISGAWEGIKSLTSTAWNGIKSAVSGAWNGIKSAASTGWNAVKNGVSTAWNSVKTWTSNTWSNVKTTVSGAWNSVKSTASAGWNAVKNGVSSAWNNIKTNTSSVWSSVKSSLSSTWSSVKSTASSTWNSMKSTASSAWSSMKSSATSTWNGIKSSLSSTWSSIKSTASSTWSGIKNTIQNQGWSGIGSNICNGIANGINSGWSWLKNKVSSLASSLLSAAKSALGIHSPSRLFRDEVGLNIGYGVGEGVEDSQPSILKSVSGVADAIADEMNAGDYAIKTVVPTAEVNGALDNFTRTISDSFTSMLDRLQSIAKSVTFTAPTIAQGIVPYKAAAAAGGASADVSTAIEASNDELASVVTQVVMTASNAIVTAIQNYSGTTVNLDKTAIAEIVVKEINRRTRMAGQSPLMT